MLVQSQRLGAGVLSVVCHPHTQTFGARRGTYGFEPFLLPCQVSRTKARDRQCRRLCFIDPLRDVTVVTGCYYSSSPRHLVTRTRRHPTGLELCWRKAASVVSGMVDDHSAVRRTGFKWLLPVQESCFGAALLRKW